MDTTVYNSGTVQFTFFLIKSLKIIMVTNYGSFIVIFEPYISLLKIKMDSRNTSET